MPKFVDGWWPGNPAGATRASRQPCRFRSFVPDPLVGQDLTLPSAIAADLVDVETQIRALNAATGPAINLEPLARFLLRAEAVASSNIEGLQINVRRLARKEAAVREGWDSTDDMAAAVLGNIRAVDRALSIAVNTDAAITVDTIREIHAALLAGTRERAWAGVVRHEQNWIGGPHPGAAAFVPPPPDRVPELLVDLAAYLSRDDHPALLQAALAHSQFETIHPFADGNGRTGRALIQLVLRRRGLAPSVVPPISLVLATESSRYIDALMATRSVEEPQTGMLQWVGLFVDVTAQACRESLRFGHQLHDLESLHRERAGRVRADSATDRLIRVLPAIPVFTVKTAADAIGRSQVAVSQAVDRLLAAGVVRQITVGRRNRAFEATEILDAFTGFERALASPHTDTSVAPPVRPVPARPGSRGSVRHRG